MIHEHKTIEIGAPRFTGRKNYVSGITISQNEHVTSGKNSDRPVSSDKQNIEDMVHGHIEDKRPIMA